MRETVSPKLFRRIRSLLPGAKDTDDFFLMKDCVDHLWKRGTEGSIHIIHRKCTFIPAFAEFETEPDVARIQMKKFQIVLAWCMAIQSLSQGRQGSVFPVSIGAQILEIRLFKISEEMSVYGKLPGLERMWTLSDGDTAAKLLR